MKKKHNYCFIGEGKGRHSEHYTALTTREKFIRPYIWNEYEKIAIIRHPYDWVVSLYNLTETRLAWGQDNTKPFSEFIQNLDINMFYWLTDERGFQLVDKIYKLEELSEVLKKYKAEVPHLNKTNKPIELSKADKACIDEKFWREFKYYRGENENMVGTSIVEGIEYAPEGRGLTQKEKYMAKTPVPDPEGRIESIIKHGIGDIVVLKTDGHRYRRYNGTLAWRNNNPGNLKYGKFAKSTNSIGPGQGNHAVYASMEDGKRAMWELLFTDVRDYHNKTIIRVISKYAPASDKNRPKVYAAYVAAHAEVPVTTKLNEMTIFQQQKMVEAMMVFEGYKEGQEAVIS